MPPPSVRRSLVFLLTGLALVASAAAAAPPLLRRASIADASTSAAAAAAAAAAATRASDSETNGLQLCLEFLTKHMPARDKPLISDHELVATAALALRARRGAAWARAVPLKIFLNDVLPYRHLDEPYQPWRKLFFQKLAPLVAGASSITEAAQIINRDVWALFSDPPIHFVPDQAPEILSPAQVIAAGFASCSGLSIFLASACRAVGIPARVAGTPSWVEDRRDLSKGDRFNNHNWVEVWDGGAWSFTGACEYRPEGLNRTWFFPQPAKSALPGSTMHAIYAASYQTTGLTFPLAWAPQDREVPAVDVTQGYIDAEEPGPPS